MQTSTHQNPVRFLLVEDDEDHAVLIQRAMKENRIANALEHCADGASAMKYLRREPPYEAARRPDVVLLDLKLPIMDGHEVLDAIKSDDRLKSIPVVVLTTSQAESDRARAYARNANSYLVKPIDFQRFNNMIQDLKMYWAVWNQPPG